VSDEFLHTPGSTALFGKKKNHEILVGLTNRYLLESWNVIVSARERDLNLIICSLDTWIFKVDFKAHYEKKRQKKVVLKCI